MQDHLKALEKVHAELDEWMESGDESEGWIECFPEAIEGDQTPDSMPHTLWQAVVELQEIYPRKRLPVSTGARKAWANLLHYSRQNGSEDRLVQKDLALANAKALREWICVEIEKLNCESRNRAGEQASDLAPASSTGFLGGAELADALGVDTTRKTAFARQLDRMRDERVLAAC